MYDVVTFGSAVVDISVKSDQFKVVKSHQVEGGVAMCEVYGGKSEVQSIGVSVGGGAINSAVNFCRKGLLVSPVIKIGEDWAGGLVKDVMRKEKLGSELTVVDEAETGMSVILIANDGGRSILTHRAQALEAREVNWEATTGAKRYYVASLGGNKTFLEDMFSWAKLKNAKVAFNPGKGELSWGQELVNFLRKCDVVFMNRSEVCEWLGVEYGDEENLTAKVQTQGIPMLVMTEGKEGATVFMKDKIIKSEAFKVKSVDDTGAGDAFGSSFVFGLDQGWEIGKILHFASASAASVVLQTGSLAGILSLSDYAAWEDRNLVIEERLLQVLNDR